jgi:hypothetical protein
MADAEMVAHYLERAAHLRLIADGYFSKKSAESLIAAAEVYEDMAAALERLAA